MKSTPIASAPCSNTSIALPFSLSSRSVGSVVRLLEPSVEITVSRIVGKFVVSALLRSSLGGLEESSCAKARGRPIRPITNMNNISWLAVSRIVRICFSYFEILRLSGESLESIVTCYSISKNFGLSFTPI